MTFIRLARTSVAYNMDTKAKFHSQSKSILRKLAKLLGLTPGTFDLRSNMGGIAVSGEITLHSDSLYVQFSQSCLGPDWGFMWRTCKGRKDYTGGQNRWMKWDELADLDAVATKMNAALAPMFVVVD